MRVTGIGGLTEEFARIMKAFGRLLAQFKGWLGERTIAGELRLRLPQGAESRLMRSRIEGWEGPDSHPPRVILKLRGIPVETCAK